MLRLSALYRYPLKSGKAEILQQIGLDKLGLDGDRRWMLVDEASGRFLTQRAVAKMSQLSALWNRSGGLTLSSPGYAALDVALPGSEAESWRRFREEALPRFLEGTYRGEYQDALVREYEALLPESPTWKIV